MKKPRIGVLGGIFDPIHFGHIHIAKAVCEKCQLDKVLMIPASVPPHKVAPGASFADRFSMLTLAIASTPSLEASAIEADIQPSYTVKTLRALHEKMNAQFYLILGADTFAQLPTWYEWQTLFTLTHLIVVNREGHEASLHPALIEVLNTRRAKTLEALHAAPAGLIYHLTLPPLAISSTKIRTEIARGESISGMCPEKVIDFITVNHLYHTTQKRGTYAN